MTKVTITMTNQSHPPEQRRAELTIVYAAGDAVINLPIDVSLSKVNGPEAAVQALHMLMKALDDWNDSGRHLIPASRP